MMDKIQDVVKDMVTDQLRAAGFDPDLTAGALPTSTLAKHFSYAMAAARPCEEDPKTQDLCASEQRPKLRMVPTTQLERQEAKF